MILQFIMLAFGQLIGRRGRQAPRPAIAPASRPVSLPQASKRIAEVAPERIKVEQPRRKASATTVRTEPTSSPKSRVSGSSVGGRQRKKGKEPTAIPPTPDVMMPMSPTHVRGHLSNSVISFEDPGTSPPGPIELEYETRQNGSSKRLAQYKKMYKGSTYELPTPSLIVGGVEDQKDSKLQPSTMAGFGRSNVHWPYAWHDYVSGNSKQLTSKTACFTRTQIEDCFRTIWQSWMPGTVDIDLLLNQLEGSIGGNERIDWPLDYIECEYTYLNNNVGLPAELSVYVCQPKKDLRAIHNPMSDWFYPWGNQLVSGSELMSPLYQYNPILTASKDVMFQYSSGSVSGVNMVANADNILTASTEVVPEATPQGFSSKFRRNWEVLHVQQVVLQPQQELRLTFRVKMSQMFDFKKFLSSDSPEDKFELFEGLSMFPLIKYRGMDTTGVSRKLQRKFGATDGNRFLTTSAPRSGPTMISTGMKTRMRCHVKSVPATGSPTGIVGQPTVSDVLDTFSISKRELLYYDSFERGQQMPYFNVNDNLGYFSSTATKPATNEVYTSVVELNVKELPATASFPSTDASIAQANLVLASVEDDWGILDAKTTTRNRMIEAKSDISVN